MYQIKLPDSIRYVDSLEDFYSLIDKYMGDWARKYLENTISRKEEKLNIELTDLEESNIDLESDLENTQGILADIRDLVVELKESQVPKEAYDICNVIIRLIDNI